MRIVFIIFFLLTLVVSSVVLLEVWDIIQFQYTTRMIGSYVIISTLLGMLLVYLNYQAEEKKNLSKDGEKLIM